MIESIRNAIERLYQDESLTADVDDAPAKVLLGWGEGQIRAGWPEEEVRQAVRALNRILSRRNALTPTEALVHLEAAGLHVDEAVLSNLWAEAPAEDIWAERLVQALLPHRAGNRGERASISFEIVAEDPHSAARAGILHTPHGDVPTPVFIPVGTQATVKTVSPDELREGGATIVLANTYHLYLRPGTDVVAELGGLHRFMAWDGPILTDSGGFQVFSLAANRQVAEEGVTFRSHIDGSLHLFTPEKVIEFQEKLGADVIMPLDECTPYPCSRDYAEEAHRRTLRWAERSRQAHRRPEQALFGIVQGSIYPDLRRESAETLADMDFPGFAIGGLSVGEPKEAMHAMLEVCVSILPREKPRHLLGVGSPEDFFEGVARGMDMFDCVLPTRIARHGALLVREGRLNIHNASYARDPRPVEEGCTCYTCRRFSRAYLRHLFQSREILGLRLATLHNLHFLLRLLEGIRRSILHGMFPVFKEEFLSTFRPVPEEVRQNEAARRRPARSRSNVCQGPLQK